MNKKELVQAIATKADLTAAVAGNALDAFVNAITEALAAGDDVTLTGVFSLKVGQRPAREGRNPATGEKLHIPAKNVIKFKAGKLLEEAVK